jgi:hypothetical protein
MDTLASRQLPYFELSRGRARDDLRPRRHLPETFLTGQWRGFRRLAVLGQPVLHPRRLRSHREVTLHLRALACAHVFRGDERSVGER